MSSDKAHKPAANHPWRRSIFVRQGKERANEVADAVARTRGRTAIMQRRTKG
jgi:hypothetical protein